MLDTCQSLGGDSLPVSLSLLLPQLGERLHKEPPAELVWQQWKERVHGLCKLYLQHATCVLGREV